MASINGVNNQPDFSPVNRENNSPNNLDGKSVVDSLAGSLSNNPEFQVLFKSLLGKILSNGKVPAESNAQNGAAGPLSSGADNNISILLSLLEQMQLSDLSAQNGDQTDDQLLRRLVFGLNKATAQNSSELIGDTPYSQVLSKYIAAMRNLNASNRLPTGTLDGVNINTVDENLGAVQNGSASGIQGLNPAKEEVIEYITEECKKIGIPEQLGLATAATESGMSQFNKDGTPCRNNNHGSTDWGIMQINDRAWGDVFDFNRIKSDWKYNVRAGLQILKNSYDAAVKNDEGSKGLNGTPHNLARAAYSGYNAGVANLWRYRIPVDNAPKTGLYDVVNDQGYDTRDIRFWANYQKLL